MKIDVKLVVYLKGTDLVAETAYLALVGKMGYESRLVALKRFDHHRFIIESEAPERAASDLKDVLARQSTFYNRNKHNHVLECVWEGGELREGPELAALRKRVLGEATKRVIPKRTKDFDGKTVDKKVILEGNQLFLVESLVEEQDSAVRASAACKLQVDLKGAAVDVPNSGTLWWLVLSADSEAEARAAAEEVLVCRKRDRGLLLNPNYQRFEILALAEMEPGKNV
ncbi:MAG: hypothetical protein GTO51_08945 [Candidatus Latescibacteria bacterium]|nr:hypothetical protein [Candidatus Latescibacterota bacterium]NIM22078.1 hypothetical protein [Candidatus Latescibacterota bacterium]NIM66097.1 hypothetical protein [Candidatus Latescibacterota bacterium]NIO02505.1 hypothetical protein [Candidatus Latescibacterota bacterium]NIO29416.1 hypothetical protein [Candidatus Latescibacterota bacterium]